MTHRAAVLLILVAVLAARPLAQRTCNERAAWNQPFAPFHLIGNIHYVGAAGVSAFLIVTPEGSILPDGGLPETAPQIVRNMTTLGFHLRDVKYLLNSHAHFDHARGLAELKRTSAARLVASARERPRTHRGRAGHACRGRRPHDARRRHRAPRRSHNDGLGATVSWIVPPPRVRLEIICPESGDG